MPLFIGMKLIERGTMQTIQQVEKKKKKEKNKSTVPVFMAASRQS